MLPRETRLPDAPQQATGTTSPWSCGKSRSRLSAAHGIRQPRCNWPVCAVAAIGRWSDNHFGASLAMDTVAIMWTDQMQHALAELQQRPLLQRLLVFATQRGVELYTVGGTLRDLCLGRPIHDV